MSEPKSNYPSASDPDRYFRTDHLEEDLKGRSVRSGAVTLTAQVAKFLLIMLSNIVLARLLAPEDYGLMAMLATVTNLVNNFQDLGLSQATVQSSKINHKQVSTLFWINVVFGVAIALVFAALSPAIAWFYKEPRLTAISVALSVGFILGGLRVQHQALLRRQMRFSEIAAIDIISLIVSIGVAIVCAWYGSDYWSLVIMQLVMGLIGTVGSWMACSWRPGLPSRHSGIRSMMAFGGHLTGFNILNYFIRNFDNVLIGWRWGAVELGLYAKAYQLLLLPIQQINTPIGNVALPALSRLQSDPERYKSYYYKGIRLMVALGMPLVAFLFVVADKAILVILGQQWVDTIPIFRLLAPAAFVGTFNMATGWVCTSLGRADRLLAWNIISAPITVLSFIIGLPWGATGVATTYSICVLTIRIPGIIHAFVGSPLRLTDFTSTIARPALASIGAGVVLAGIDQLLPEMNAVVALLVDSTLYGLFYIALWLTPPNGKQALLEMLNIAKSFKPKNKTS